MCIVLRQPLLARVSSGHGYDRSASSKIETGSKFLTVVMTMVKIWPILAIKVAKIVTFSRLEYQKLQIFTFVQWCPTFV